MRLRYAQLGLVWAAATMMTALVAPPAAAQVYTGRIDVTVVDSTGAVLPGVNVDVAGPQNQTQVSDARGEAHFLNLAPGTYQVTAKLAGFADYVNKTVPVGTGVSVPLKATMGVSGVAQTVEVTAESPVVDVKKTSEQTNVTLQELQEVPSARDPWVVMQTVPGIIVDRVNVGGSESGQQSNYQAKGASGGENTWNMDGIPITDMAALGSTPTYYDFDMFEEMQVTTGGADVRNATPGVQLNMVLKSGTNTPHGNARGYFENESMQANNMPSDLVSRLGGTSGKGNRMHKYTDWGGDLGGPIVKDRLWAWGALGRTDVQLLTLKGTPDRTKLNNYSGKVTGQISHDIRANFTYFRGNKLKWGRGAGPLNPPETTYDQTGPTSLYKGETNFVFGSNVFFALRGAYTKGGFQLAPEGGLNTQWYIDDNGVNHGSVDLYKTDRPQWDFSGDGSFFRGRHELKYGFGWRKANVLSSDIVPGNGIISHHAGYPLIYAEVTRGAGGWGGAPSETGRYYNAFLGDTISLDRLTINAGVRWDRQSSSLNPNQAGASPVMPNLLPAITAAGASNAIVWNAVTPRLGLNYALNESRRTIARVSYAIFASQLNATNGSTLSSLQYAGAYFYAIDKNGNNVADPNELLIPCTGANGCPGSEALPGTGLIDFYGFDPTDPTRLTAINSIGKYRTPLTQEVVVGLDHQLAPNFGVSGAFTWRHFSRFTWSPIQGINGSQYVQVGTLTGDQSPVGSYSVPLYGLPASQVPATRGTIYQERPDYHQRYYGFELSATKRMSNRWMARFGFSTNDHREYFDSPAGMGNPTPTPNWSGTSGAGPNIDGGLVVRQTGGSGKSGIYMVLPKYQFILNGAYQAPLGIDLGVNMSTRQGYSAPYYRTSVPVNDPLGPRKTVLVASGVDQFRLPTVTSLDARVGKSLHVANVRFNVDLDIFNLLNSNTVLGRQFDLRSGLADQVLEIMNPRILRLGVRMNF